MKKMLQIILVAVVVSINWILRYRERKMSMNEELLARLADTLERINMNLSEIAATLEALVENQASLTASNGKHHFLCITGDIATR